MKKAEKQAGSKRCTKCKKSKDKGEFGKHSGHKDGLTHWCKDCMQKNGRLRYRKKRKSVKKYYRYEQNHRVVDGVRQKRCYRCRKWKAESMYYKRRRSIDGLYVWCKECANKATNKARRQRKLAVRN
ncbi:MAG: hypothetical protein ACYS91_02395 [Planctomycetota bacterium]